MNTAELQSSIDLHLVPKLHGPKGIEVLEQWRDAAHSRVDATVEIASQFQRPGTGRLKLPQNVCLVLTSDEVVAFKFNPRNTKHPLKVRPKQIESELERWPRAEVSVTSIDPAGMTSKATFVLAGEERQMRCPPLSKNPSALAVLFALGGSIETGVAG